MQKREIEKSWVQSKSHFTEDELTPAKLKGLDERDLDYIIKTLVRDIDRLRAALQTVNDKVDLVERSDETLIKP